jgi:hypothetical protein
MLLFDWNYKFLKYKTMEFKTKFNLGEELFVLSKSCIAKGTVIEIAVHLKNDNRTEVWYTLQFKSGYKTSFDETHSMGRNKDELIAMLKEEEE